MLPPSSSSAIVLPVQEAVAIKTETKKTKKRKQNKSLNPKQIIVQTSNFIGFYYGKLVRKYIKKRMKTYKC